MTTCPPAQWLRRGFVHVCLVLSCSLATVTMSAGPQSFDIPAGEATETLRRAAQQGGREIMFPANIVRGVRTSPVSGTMTLGEALSAMLADTGLQAVEDPSSGAVTVSRETRRAPRRDADGTARRADEMVSLPAFLVEEQALAGYRATNSISGTKTNTAILDLPINLQVVTEEFMRDTGMLDSQETLNYAANARTSGRTEVIIRGFSSQLQLRDGFRRYDSVDTSMLSRVEVISGPASVLYGQAAPGGIVNYISKRPLEENRVQFAQRFGWNNFLRSTVDVNYAGGEQWSARGIFSFQHKETDLRYDEEEIMVINPIFQFSPFQNTTVTLNLEKSDYERGANRHPVGLLDNGISIVLRHGTPLDANFYGQDAKSNNYIEVGLLTVDQKIGDNLSLRLGLNVAERDNPLDHPDGIGIQTNPANGQRQVRFYWRDRRSVIESRNVVLDGVYKFATGGLQHQVLAGYSYLYNYERLTQYEDLLPNGQRAFRFFAPTFDVGLVRKGAVNMVYIPGTAAKTYSEVASWYATHQLRAWDDRLVTLAGVYYTDINNRTKNDTQATYREFDGDHVGPQLGAVFRPLPWASLFAVTSASLLPTAPGQLDGFDRPFDPETGRSVEAGLKIQSADQRYSGTLSAYSVKQQNIVVFDPEAPNKNNPTADPNFARGANVQFGEIESRGVDLDFFASPWPSVQFVTGYAYLDQTILKDGNKVNIGRNVTGRSEHNFRVWTLYDFDGALKGLSIGAGYRWSSEPLARYNSAGQPEYNEDISNGDAMVRYRGKAGRFRYSVTANVRNLNEQGRVDGVDFAGKPFKTRFPREWFVSGTLEF